MKRGHHCWISIEPSDARKKVAQALQYQRRKQRKVGNSNSDGPDCCENGLVPSPPDLRRQTAIHLNPSDFSAAASKPHVPMRCNKYQMSPPFELVQSCPLVLTKNKVKSKYGAVKTPSFSKSSIVQAAAIANIATCGKPTYSSPSNSLNRLLTKSRKSAVQSSTGQYSIELKTKVRGKLIPQQHQQQQQQQHQETDLSYLPILSCATNAYAHDSSGIFSFSDLELAINNDYFEQDEPFSISATGEEHYE